MPLNLKHNQKGIILPMTMIILAILLSISVGFAVFVISDINQARAVDNSTLAYYAADAGLERSLFLIRKAGVTTTDALTKNGTLAGNNSSWNTSSSTDYEKVVLRQRLYEGESFKLYFLNRAGGNNVNCLKLIYNDDCTMQASFTQLSPTTDSNGIVSFLTDQSPLVHSGETDIPFKPVVPAIGRIDYVVEFKNLFCIGVNNIDRVNIYAYDDLDCSSTQSYKSISNLTLDIKGTERGSSQEITATLPPRDPISGLFGFVLFSDQSITKGGYQ